MKKTISRAEQAAAVMGGECLAMRTRLIGRTITGIYDDALRDLGVTAGQLNILAVVLRRGPVSPGEVANYLNIEKSTMSRNVERMNRNGWVAVRSGESARSREVAITQEGRRVLTEAEPLWRVAQDRAREILGTGGVKAVHRLADSIRERSAGR